MNKLLFPLALGLVLGLPTKVFAHAVQTNFVMTSDLELQSVFSTGEPFQQAEVKVFAPNNPNEPWLQGTTDEKGNFSFKPDPSIPGNWEVQIGEGGHADYLTVPVTEQGVDEKQISDSDPLPAWLVLAAGVSTIGTCGGVVWTLNRRRR